MSFDWTPIDRLARAYGKDAQPDAYCGFSDYLSGPSHVWLKYSPGSENGTTWWPLGTDKIQVDAGTQSGLDNRGIYLQTGPPPVGILYATWTGHDISVSGEGAARAVFARYSTDRGLSWNSPTHGQRIKELVGFNPWELPGKAMRVRVFPSMTVDQRTGHVYVVYTDREPGRTDTDVYVLKSADEGRTWNALGGTPQDPAFKRVNQDPLGSGKDQWHAAITWDDTTGALVAVFYDSRDYTGNDGVNTYLAVSYDGAVTWQDVKVSDAGWDGDPPPGPLGDPFAGDYIGVAARDGLAYPVWSDDRQVPDAFRPYISPIHVWGVIQESISHSVLIQPDQKIELTASWGTYARAKGTDQLILESPPPSSTTYTESCATCWSNGGLNHSMTAGAPCTPGWWKFEVRSTRLGYAQRGSFKVKFLVNCID